MPTRIVREGILTSERVNSLSAGAELFYRRLMSVADDYGRYFAHASILRANCYPLQLDKVTEAQVLAHLKECVDAKLVVIYDAGKHLSIDGFKQQARSKSKFPDFSPQVVNPSTLINCKADANQMCSLVGGEGEGEGEYVVGAAPESAGRDASQNPPPAPPTRFEEYRGKLNAMFGRPKNSSWSYSEESRLAECVRRQGFDAEFAEIEAFKAKPLSFFPRSLSRLLDDWGAVLDRSRQPNEAAGLTGPQIVSRNKELEVVNQRIASIEGGDSHAELSQQEREKLRTLKARRKEIQKELGWKV